MPVTEADYLAAIGRLPGYSNGSSPPLNFGAGGHRTNFVIALRDVSTVGQWVTGRAALAVTKAGEAADSATAAAGSAVQASNSAAAALASQIVAQSAAENAATNAAAGVLTAVQGYADDAAGSADAAALSAAAAAAAAAAVDIPVFAVADVGKALVVGPDLKIRTGSPLADFADAEELSATFRLIR